ncbi:hypothetical protein MXB_4257 [Myxobolus squamalis]|nr:hypothetical protein MXB_4257 [Myxobolus squamalis]
MCYRYPDKIFVDVECILLSEWGKTNHHDEYLNRSDIEFSPNYQQIETPAGDKVVVYFRVMELPPPTPEDM